MRVGMLVSERLEPPPGIAEVGKTPTPELRDVTAETTPRGG